MPKKKSRFTACRKGRSSDGRITRTTKDKTNKTAHTSDLEMDNWSEEEIQGEDIVIKEENLLDDIKPTELVAQTSYFKTNNPTVTRNEEMLKNSDKDMWKQNFLNDHSYPKYFLPSDVSNPTIYSEIGEKEIKEELEDNNKSSGNIDKEYSKALPKFVSAMKNSDFVEASLAKKNLQILISTIESNGKLIRSLKTENDNLELEVANLRNVIGQLREKKKKQTDSKT